jgi:DNA-methyltransferase (dcm)
MAYKIVDLFAGVGGLSYGFAHDSLFEIVAANEILPNMAKAYSKNHPNVKMYNRDIKDFSAKELYGDIGIDCSEIDIIVGGPPCQAYSTVGKRLEDDPRGKLFIEYYRILSEISPSIFVFENVKGILSIQKGELFKKILSLFKSLGYNIYWKVLNAADYGVPQIRERVIIVGSKFDKEYIFPSPTHYNPDIQSLYNNKLTPYVTLGEALSDLSIIDNGETGIDYSTEPKNQYQRLMRKNAPIKLMDHSAPKNNEKLVEIMKHLPDGGTPLDIPEEIRPRSGFKNTYCRLWWDKPSTTITRNFGCPSSSRCIHPKYNRSLTTREGARLQGFPDDYVFIGSRSDKNLQIGNAVPTMLSEALKNSIKEYLSKI